MLLSYQKSVYRWQGTIFWQILTNSLPQCSRSKQFRSKRIWWKNNFLLLFWHLCEILRNLREYHVYGSPSLPFTEINYLNLHILIKNDTRKFSIVYLTTNSFKIFQRHSIVIYMLEFMIRKTIILIIVILKFQENSKKIWKN